MGGEHRRSSLGRYAAPLQSIRRPRGARASGRCRQDPTHRSEGGAVTISSAELALLGGSPVRDRPFPAQRTLGVEARNAVLLQNAIPVFADVDDVTYGLDPDSVESCLTPRTRGIVVTHLFGHPARMAELMRIADANDLVVIEDAAQSIGATFHESETGTIGTAGVLSLNYHKIIHSGEGGIVLTDDAR